MLGACHAKLCRLRNVVDNDVDTVKQLKVIGVLQAGKTFASGNLITFIFSTDNFFAVGRWTQIYVASCVGRNIVFLTEGTLWELPLEIVELKKVYNLISAAWKCKVSILSSFIENYRELLLTYKFLENHN